MRGTTVRLPESLHSLAEAVSQATGSTEDVPYLNKSAVIRTMLHDSASRLLSGEMDVGDLEAADVTGQDLADLIPEHTRLLYQREAFKEGEAQLRNLRTGFEARIFRHFKSRFKSGFVDGQLEEWAVNMKMDAKILFSPSLGGEDEDPHRERREDCLAYVDALIDGVKRADEASTFDPLSPENFENFGKVEEGRELDEERSLLRDSAADVIEDVADRLGPGRDTEAIVDAVAKTHGVRSERVRELVDRVRNGEDVSRDRLEQAAEEVAALPDGGESSEDEGDEWTVLTDGGHDVASPGTERYWSDLQKAEAASRRVLEEGVRCPRCGGRWHPEAPVDLDPCPGCEDEEEPELVTDGGEDVPSILSLVRESLEDEATLHSLTVTGEADETTFVSVVYSEPYEGDTMLKERFFAVDEETGEGGWTGQGINRRVTGSFASYATAMVRAYARVQQDAKSGERAETPLLGDAREGRGSEVDFRLSGPIGGRLEEDDEPDEQAAEFTDERPTEETSDEDLPTGHVRCKRCGEVIDKRDAEQFSSGPPLGEVWVHADLDACGAEEEADA